MTLPSADTPLYNHPLPDIETWLIDNGCQQDDRNLHHWHVKKAGWEAEIVMEIDAFAVRYFNASDDGRDIQRSFKYSLSRQDLEAAIFSGP
ncbi:MAG: DUF3143 domain-containing protein [Oculatellaceae cyanobacterium bins.114]|nr:DUF3143 domain-containing protein [Oculatellaceae cyanobacterium bins.114]